MKYGEVYRDPGDRETVMFIASADDAGDSDGPVSKVLVIANPATTLEPGIVTWRASVQKWERVDE